MKQAHTQSFMGIHRFAGQQQSRCGPRSEAKAKQRRGLSCNKPDLGFRQRHGRFRGRIDHIGRQRKSDTESTDRPVHGCNDGYGELQHFLEKTLYLLGIVVPLFEKLGISDPLGQLLQVSPGTES